MLTIKHDGNANKDYFLCQENILTSYILFDLRPYYCLGSLEIRKIGILFSDKLLPKPKITFMLSGYFSMTNRKLIVLFNGGFSQRSTTIGSVVRYNLNIYTYFYSG